MSRLGDYSLQDALNRCLPIAKRAKLGDLLQDLIDGVNGIANKLDQQGGLGAVGTVTATTGGTIHAGDTYTLTVRNPSIVSLVSPGVVLTGPAIAANDTLTTVANALANMVNTNATMQAAGITATASSSVATIRQGGTIANTTTITSALKSGASITVTMGNAGVMAGGTGTFGGTNAATLGNIPPLSSR